MRYPPLFIAALLLAATPAALATTYRIDSAHTFPQFEIRHLQFSMLHGQFNQTSGTITMNRAKKMGSVDVTVQVDSIDTGNAARNRDLMASSFFDAAKYPTMIYRSTKVVYRGKDRATVYGKLTLKGVTKPATLHVTRIYCAPNPFGGGERCGFDAKGEINRTAFGVSGDAGMIPDTVYLIINSDAVSRPANK